MPSSHLILGRPLLLLPLIPPSIRVFSNQSTLTRIDPGKDRRQGAWESKSLSQLAIKCLVKVTGRKCDLTSLLQDRHLKRQTSNPMLCVGLSNDLKCEQWFRSAPFIPTSPRAPSEVSGHHSIWDEWLPSPGYRMQAVIASRWGLLGMTGPHVELTIQGPPETNKRL